MQGECFHSSRIRSLHSYKQTASHCNEWKPATPVEEGERLHGRPCGREAFSGSQQGTQLFIYLSQNFL
ncbi:MAG: hypothetical protein EA344_00265 [Alkalicoccus sp.]|nr:MAG: hypothetical protein EA344_00265 [Alkalicoccus sp.]